VVFADAISPQSGKFIMNYLFLLGCHRSGTTMLQQALNRHSQIAIPAETKYFSSFLGHSHACQLRRLERINRDLEIRLPPPERVIRNDADARQFYGRMAAAYLGRLGKPEVTYFGEKTPVHSGYVPRIKHLFPASKFLWIYRDGRDVALSMRKVSWLNQTLAVNFVIWLFYYFKQMRAAADTSLDILFVRYEELVGEPAKILSSICHFLGIRFEGAMADGYGNHEGILDWEHPWKGLALEPITTGRVETWRTELTPAEVELLEWLGGNALVRLGYQLEHPKPAWSNLRFCPGILLGMMKCFARVPMDEMSNQFLGRAICEG
jgi:hypothetical protein